MPAALMIDEPQSPEMSVSFGPDAFIPSCPRTDSRSVNKLWKSRWVTGGLHPNKARKKRWDRRQCLSLKI